LEKADKSVRIKKAFNVISSHSLLTQLLDAMPMICLLLNKERQIVFANKATLGFIKLEDRCALSGLRPGEALHCVHAFERDDGCGTTVYCRMRGTAQALQNQHAWDEDGHEYRILRSNGMEALITDNYLKGKVSFESSPETGTVFRITCPKDFSN
jgi:PAS domain-containing protein